MAKRETYHVRLVRPRFEVQYLTVQAANEDAAKIMALFEAGHDQADWKLIDFDSDDYHPFFERCVSEAELAAIEMTPAEAAEQFASTDRPKSDKYLLLYADTDSGYGELCEQPWFWSEGALMIADLGGDWASDLQEMMENEASEDDVEMELLGGDPSDATKALLAETLRKRPKKNEPK
jgi:hypothetical protein